MLIAESGSTKTDWVLIDTAENELIKMETIGFNPMFHSTKFIANAIAQNQSLLDLKGSIHEIHFYGASCSSDDRNLIVFEALKGVLATDNIFVKHDLDAAVYATTKAKKGIACILGTGSNAAFFDGSKTHQTNPALGYILGDEGSGAHLGKQLLKDYLYHQIPQKLKTALEDKYNLNKEIIFKNVYHQPNANVYLASFAKFLSAHKQDAYVTDLIKNGFVDFLTHHVCCFNQYKTVQTHFVGSIAFHFKAILEEACSEKNINIGSIIHRPIDGLVEYHQSLKK